MLTLRLSVEDQLISICVTIALGIWLPMILITVVYILMYIKLKRQAKIRRHTTSHDSQAQMNSISRTFTMVVVVFYICYLPPSILLLIYLESIHRQMSIDDDAYTVTVSVTDFLWYSNSCLNPIIYSRIHEKIYECIKKSLEHADRNFPY